jgi:hypothetical protein
LLMLVIVFECLAFVDAGDSVGTPKRRQQCLQPRYAIVLNRIYINTERLIKCQLIFNFAEPLGRNTCFDKWKRYEYTRNSIRTLRVESVGRSTADKTCERGVIFFERQKQMEEPSMEKWSKARAREERTSTELLKSEQFFCSVWKTVTCHENCQI